MPHGAMTDEQWRSMKFGCRLRRRSMVGGVVEGDFVGCAGGGAGDDRKGESRQGQLRG